MNRNGLIALVVVVLLVIGGFVFLSRDNGDNERVEVVTQESQDQQAAPTSVMEQDNTAPTGAMEETEVKEFTVESRGLVFTPKEIRVKKGDTVKVTYKNTQGTHDWQLDEFNAGTQMLSAGEEETVEFVANKAGTFEFYCSVSGHRQAGMKGAFIVE